MLLVSLYPKFWECPQVPITQILFFVDSQLRCKVNLDEFDFGFKISN